jgi:hypothetical protein
MPFSFDPKTLKPWWEALTPWTADLELILAQRENFYVLIRHWPGNWIAVVGEGKSPRIPL